jgi:hypothetical protein
MTTQYIIKFIKDIDEKTQSIDGFVELSKNSFDIPVLKVRTHKDASHVENNNLLHQFIVNSSSQILFADESRYCDVVYKNTFTNNFTSSRIMFDESSSSAFSEFKKNLESFINSKQEIENYPSGRVMYVGQVLYKKDNETQVSKRVPHGPGTLYYNLPGNKVKYSGEFEEGQFDGAGTFYGTDGKVRVVCNNISGGIPVQKAKLYYKFNNNEEYVDINFTEFWDKIGITSRIDKKKYIASDDFIPNLARQYWSNNDYSLEELVFKDKSTDEKQAEFWNQLKVMTNQINSNHLKQMERMNETNSFLQKVVAVMFVMNLFLLFKI